MTEKQEPMLPVADDGPSGLEPMLPENDPVKRADLLLKSLGFRRIGTTSPDSIRRRLYSRRPNEVARLPDVSGGVEVGRPRYQYGKSLVRASMGGKVVRIYRLDFSYSPPKAVEFQQVRLDDMDGIREAARILVDGYGQTLLGY